MSYGNWTAGERYPIRGVSSQVASSCRCHSYERLFPFFANAAVIFLGRRRLKQIPFCWCLRSSTIDKRATHTQIDIYTKYGDTM